ncbi:MAG TPA: hypothetical protein VHC68_02170 [Candidatus Paceibacterota bacterium]|nr:hypothetical protein [Candidatus Paceibacterota bacterium]
MGHLALDASQLGQLADFYGGVAHTLSPAWSYASSFLILIVLVLFFVGFARLMGYGPFVGLIAALYIGYALYAVFPYGEYLPSGPPMTALGARVALYLGFFVISYILLRKIAASDFVHIGTVGLIVIAVCTAGFIMALAYQSFPVRTVYQFSASLDQLFAAKEWFFAWFAAPIAALYLFAHAR